MTTQRTTEIELLQASLAGSSEAFEAIVKRYQSLVCAITYSATTDLERSEELAQQTFVNAWRNLAQLKDLNKFRTWLCSIARSVIRNFLRDKGRDIISTAAPFDKISPPPRDTAQPSDILIGKEQQAIVSRALQHVPQNYREPLILFYREQKSLKQVADQLQLSESTARQRVARGRRMLKDQVAAMVENTISQTGPTTAFTAAVGASIAALALETAAAAGAAAATTATTTTSGAAASAAASGITTKIIAAAAVMTIAAGAVVTYRQLTRETRKPESTDAPPAISRQDTPIPSPQTNEKEAVAREDITSNEISAAPIEPISPGPAIDTSPPPRPQPTRPRKEFVFKPTGVLSGLITDANTRRPIENVEVRISNSSEHHSANSDANGIYFFHAIGSDGPFEIILEAKEHITAEEWKRPRQFVQLLRNRQIVKHFELIKGCRLNITAVDEQANPVRNVGFVAAYTADDMGRGPKRMVFTDKRGNVVLGGLKPAEYLIIAFHKDYALAGQKVVLTELGQVESLEFLIQEGIDIEGSAVCLDGLPASGWRIGAEPRWFHCVRHKIDEQISDEGLFTLPHIVPGLHRVGISIPHGGGGSTGLWSTDINLPPDNGFLELNIPKYSPHGRVSISGTLKFTGGKCGRGVWITARDQNGNFGTTYAEKGQTEFRIDNLVPGLYAVEVDTPGPRLRDKSFPNIKAPSEGLVFEIPVQEAKARIRGTVIDKQTREPVTDFNLLICGPGYAVQISDPNGQFDVEVSAHEPRAVQITAEGYACKTSDPITPDANEPIVIELGMPAAIEGTVVDEAGKPIPGVNISYRYARTADESPEARYITATDANGAFVIDGVSAESTWRWFVIRHPDYAPVTRLIDVEEGLVTDVKIVLKEGGTVEGYVYDRQGKPMPDTAIHFMDESSYHRWYANRGCLGAVTTDSNGFYRIRHLPEKLCYAFKQESRKQVDPVTAAVLAKDGQTSRLDIGGNWHATGRLLKDGRPFTYTEMAIMGNTAGYETAFKTYATTDSQGRFTFYGIPTGRRYLYWPIPGMTGHRKWAELGRFYFQTGVDLDLGDFHVDLVEVTIELTGGDPAHPIEQWDVYVQKYTPEWLAPWGDKIGTLLPRSEVTEAYTFSNIPLGKYEAIVNCQQHRLVHKVFELTQEQKHHKVSLHIPAGSAALQGRIRTPDKEQAQGDFTLRASDHNLSVFIKPEPDGVFRAENLPAGSYTLGRGHLRDSVLKRITLTDGRTTTLDVNLEDAEKDSDGYMVVLVVAEDGQPLAGADVRLERGGRIIRPHSDSDMGKSLQGPSGQYLLCAEYPGYKSVRQTVIMKSRHEFNTQQILEPVVVTMYAE